MNHRCSPDTIHVTDRPSFSIQIFAARAIKGEEITTSYCDPLLPCAARQAKLKPYGVHCSGPACLNPSESDEKRHRISSTNDALPAIINSVGNSSFPTISYSLRLWNC